MSVAPGGANDPTAANSIRHNLLNLQWLIYEMVSQPWVVNLVVFGLAGVLTMVTVAAHRRPGSSRHALLAASALAMVSVLPVYHRFYDGALLLLPLAWSLAAWRGPYTRFAAASMVCMLPFLLPGAEMLRQYLLGGRLPAAWGDTWWWNVLVQPHQVWAILILAIVLTWALARSAADSARAG
jgi:hypothetical protein